MAHPVKSQRDIPAKPTPLEVQVLERWLSRLSPHTARAYAGDLRAFQRWLGRPPVEHLQGLSRKEGTVLLNEYAAYLESLAESLAPATCLRRWESLRSFLRALYSAEIIGWTLTTKGPKLTPDVQADVEGPSLEECQACLDHLSSLGDPKSIRDLAIFRLLLDRALRVGEVCALRTTDFDGQSILVKRKGRRNRIRLYLPAKTIRAINDHIETNDPPRNSLFQISPRGVRFVLKALAERALDRHLWPHALRHTALTYLVREGLSRGWTMKDLMSYSGHRSLSALQRYIDAAKRIDQEISDVMADATS